jgi:hypothetical protein
MILDEEEAGRGTEGANLYRLARDEVDRWEVASASAIDFTGRASVDAVVEDEAEDRLGGRSFEVVLTIARGAVVDATGATVFRTTTGGSSKILDPSVSVEDVAGRLAGDLADSLLLRSSRAFSNLSFVVAFLSESCTIDTGASVVAGTASAVGRWRARRGAAGVMAVSRSALTLNDAPKTTEFVSM